jgi:phosphohistidine phosphatase SixA
MSNSIPSGAKLPWKQITGAAVMFLFSSLLWAAHHSPAPDSSYVVLARHGDAPGRGEPDGFDLKDCSRQRNLSENGRNQARNLGAMFRSNGIEVAKVLTSRFCRARETAELMNLGSVDNSATFDDLSFNKQYAQQLLAGERDLVASWHGPGVLLIVSHGSNIEALTGIHLEQGGMLVASMKQGELLAKTFTPAATTAAQNDADATGLFFIPVDLRKPWWTL